MKHILNFINGMASVVGSLSSHRAYIVDTGGFKADSQNLANDARRVAADFRKQGDLAYGSIAPITRKNRKGK